jgi:hypothetical protein
VIVIPRDKAEEILKKCQQLDLNEHRTMTFIEELKSIKEAVAKFAASDVMLWGSRGLPRF